MKLAKHVMKKLKRMTINILFLRIALRKVSSISKKNIPVKLLFKVTGDLTLTGNVLLGNL